MFIIAQPALLTRLCGIFLDWPSGKPDRLRQPMGGIPLPANSFGRKLCQAKMTGEASSVAG
jgi:hypothetical protein